MREKTNIKFNDQLPLKIDAEHKAALERIARAKHSTAPEMLRQAVYAIIRYADANGDESVPLEMDIGQKIQVDSRIAKALTRPRRTPPGQSKQNGTAKDV